MNHKSLKRIEMGEEAWEEYQRQRKVDDNNRSRNKFGVLNFRRRTKLKLIEYKGGRCIICGYDKPCPRAYHFHHKDPAQKDFSISQNGHTKAFEKLKQEVDKCDLLCSNCHAEKHDEEYVKDREDALKLHQEHMSHGITKTIKNCHYCNKEYMQKHGTQVYCSDECSKKVRRKVLRPSKEELDKMIKDGIPWTKLGEIYKVSDSAVKKWAISYGIDVPQKRCERIPEKECCFCKKTYKPVYEEQKFCSVICRQNYNMIKYPSVLELEEMLNNMTYEEIGIKYGVKREAIRRLAIRYNLQHIRKNKY